MSNPYVSNAGCGDSRGGSHHYHALDRLCELSSLDDRWTVEYVWVGTLLSLRWWYLPGSVPTPLLTPPPPPPTSRLKSQLTHRHFLLSAPVVAPRSCAYEQVAMTATCAARRAPSRVRCDPSRTVSTDGRSRRAELNVGGKGSEKKRTDTQEHECTTKKKNKKKHEARQHTLS